MNDDPTDIGDGQVPFADRRYGRHEMDDQIAPIELARLLEHEIQKNALELPIDDFLEIRCVSKDFATATFMVRRGTSGELRLLVPKGLARKPN